MQFTRRNRTIPFEMNGNEPAVDQETINGWPISWNPDDNRFYVEIPEEVAGARGVAAAMFNSALKGWHNTLYWARRHKYPSRPGQDDA